MQTVRLLAIGLVVVGVLLSVFLTPKIEVGGSGGRFNCGIHLHVDLDSQWALCVYDTGQILVNILATVVVGGAIYFGAGIVRQPPRS